jgi:hypothetical protein
MADNSSRTDAGGNVEPVASDDIGGVKFQRVKTTIGADGVAVDVQPPDADGKAAASLLPAAGMVWNGASWDRARGSNTTVGSVTGGAVHVSPVVKNGTSDYRVAQAADTHGDGGSGVAIPVEAPMLWNGATYDRERGNTEGTLLASAARTAQAVSPTQTNHNARGVILRLMVSAPGTGSLTVELRATGGFNIAGWSALTGTGVFVCYPGSNDTPRHGGSGASFDLPVPRTWSAVVTPTDASAWTYALDYHYVV